MSTRILALGSLLPSFHCLTYLCERVDDCQVVGFVPHQTPPRLRYEQDSARYAEDRGIPILTMADLPTLDFDLGLSLMFDRPLPGTVVEKPPLGFVNLHLGPLPRLRGSNSVLHAIRLAPVDNIWTFGITMHYMVEAVDQGPIIDTIEVPIFRDDTAQSLHARAMGEVFPLFERNIQTLVSTAGRVPSVAQDGPSYFFRKGDVDHEVDLSGDPTTVMAQIRALSFPGRPRPYIVIGGMRIYLTLNES